MNNATPESMETVREQLVTMRRIFQDRAPGRAHDYRDNIVYKTTRKVGVIDGTFLSMALMGVLCVIIAVSSYAFYTLYYAVLKKFPSRHTEL